MRTARKLRAIVTAMGLGIALVPAATPAVADDELFRSVLTSVYSIDASPYWSARMRDLDVDEDRATVSIGSLTVAAERGRFAVTLEDATLAGIKETADGGLTASSLAVGRIVFATAGSSVTATALRFDDIGAPALTGIAYDRAKPFTSLIGAYAALARMRSAGGRIGEIEIRESDQGQTSQIEYDNVVFGALDDGKLLSAAAGPLTMRAPAAEPLAELRVERAEAKGVDLDALVHVFDPLRYIAGIGDGEWRRAADEAWYRDITLTVPSIRLTIGSVAMEGMSVRQPSESFAPLIDALTSPRWPTPRTMERLRSTYLGALISAFGFDRFSVGDVVLTATGIDQLTLGSFTMTKASSDGFGEISIEDLVAAIAGQGAAQAGRFAFHDVAMPGFDTIGEALERAQSGRDVDLSALAPKIGAIDAAEIHLQAIEFPGLAVGGLRADFDNHVGTVPTALALKLEDLDVATAALPSASARTLIAGLGYDRIGVDATLSLNWHEADETLSLDDFELDIANFGNTTADLVLAGLTREAIERGDDESAFNDLRFERARVTFEDRSVVDRSLAMRADLLNIPLDRLKQQLSGALPLMLAVLGDQAKTIVPVLQDFIKTPGTLTIEATPDSPVPIVEIENAIRSRPQSLPGLLSVSLSGTTPGGAAEGNDTPAAETGSAAPGPSAPRQ